MQNFIVLGIIPGTQIELSFNFWLCVGIVFFGLLLIHSIWTSQGLRSYVVSKQIQRTINKFDLITI